MGQRDQDILKADLLGAKAFKKGIKTACHDTDLLALIEGRYISKPIIGEATTIELLSAWNRSLDVTRLYHYNLA